MIDMKKYISYLLLLVVFLSLFAACGKEAEQIVDFREKETEGSGKNTGASGNAGYEAVFCDFSLKENEAAFDILQTEDGVKLLTGVKAYLSTYLPLDEEMKPRSGNEREKTPIERTVSAVTDGEELYSLAFVAGTGNENGYVVYKNDQPIVFTGITIPEDATLSAVSQNGTDYVMTHFPGWTGVYINGQAINTDTLGTGTTNRSFAGLAKLGGKVYAVISEHRYSGNPALDMIADLLSSDGILVELTEKTKGINDEDLEKGIHLGRPVTACTVADGTLWFISEGKLFRGADEKAEQLCDLMASGMNPSDVCRRLLSDGKDGMFYMTNDYIARIEPKQAGSKEKEIITIGALDGTETLINEALTRFNWQSTRYAFTVKSYKSTSDMNLALVSKELGGIAAVDWMALDNYASKGVLAKLDELVPSVFEDGKLLPSIRKLAMKNGSCYYLPRYFNLWQTSIAENLTEGNQAFRDFAELEAFIEKKDKGVFHKNLKDIVLQQMLLLTMDEWIDREAGKAYFDTENFVELLHFCNRFAEDDDEILTNQKTYGSWNVSILDANPSVIFVRDDTEIIGPYAAKRVLLSLPTAKGDCPAVATDFFIGITAEEKYREAGAELIRWLFEECDFEETFTNAVTGEKLSVIESECAASLEIEKSFEDKSYEEVRDWEWNEISRANRFKPVYRNEMMDVIYDEAFRYFAGEITAEKAAEYIQNRVQLYLDEQG